MRWVIFDEGKTKESVDALKALEKDSDRGAAIVAVSLVEELLERKIKFLMRFDDSAKKELTEIFRSSGPLGSFSAKIQLGFLLRLYGRIAFKELNTLKDVRNEFAHSIYHLSFQVESIRAKTSNLKLVEGYMREKSDPRPSVPYMYFPPDFAGEKLKLSDPRHRFMETCGLFIVHLANGNLNLFLPIYGDDRPPLPDILLKQLHSRDEPNRPAKRTPQDPPRSSPK